MNKIFAILIFISIFNNSLSFAQEHSIHSNKQFLKIAKPKYEIKDFTGKVTNISFSDPIKETRSEIVVSIKNKSITFLVKSTTTIYAINGKPINLDKIMKNERVKVRYIITKEGLHEAISIRALRVIQ